MLLSRFIFHRKKKFWTDEELFQDRPTWKMCNTVYSFCIDNEHDEGKIKVETFFYSYLINLILKYW